MQIISIYLFKIKHNRLISYTDNYAHTFASSSFHQDRNSEVRNFTIPKLNEFSDVIMLLRREKSIMQQINPENFF